MKTMDDELGSRPYMVRSVKVDKVEEVFASRFGLSDDWYPRNTGFNIGFWVNYQIDNSQHRSKSPPSQ